MENRYTQILVEAVPKEMELVGAKAIANGPTTKSVYLKKVQETNSSTDTFITIPEKRVGESVTKETCLEKLKEITIIKAQSPKDNFGLTKIQPGLVVNQIIVQILR